MKFLILGLVMGLFQVDFCQAKLTEKMEMTLRETAELVLASDAQVDRFVLQMDDLLFRNSPLRPTSEYFLAAFRAAQKLVPERTLVECLRLARLALLEWSGDPLLFEYAFLRAQEYSRDQWSFDYAMGVASTFGSLQFYADQLEFAQKSIPLPLKEALLFAEKQALSQGAPDRDRMRREGCSAAL